MVCGAIPPKTIAPDVAAWDAALVDRIRAEVPRYEEAHAKQVINALNKLARGDVPRLQIMHGQMPEAILAVVYQYAMRRDAENANKTQEPPTQPALMVDDTPPPNQYDYDGAGPKRRMMKK